MIGPNMRPTRSVPRDWMANSANRIATARGTIQSLKPGWTYCRPSVAERTDIAGVIIESP